jgi:uncharacterized membrane protein
MIGYGIAVLALVVYVFLVVEAAMIADAVTDDSGFWVSLYGGEE